jgi:photoactive yellow protein
MVSDHTGGPVKCAWCSAELRRGNLNSPMSHGICLACMAVAAGNPIEDLSHVSPELLDALPFGAIQLSGEGIITAYNSGESLLSGLAPASVIGKDFFRQVAPCAAVQGFRGKFEALRSKGKDGNTKLLFVFKYSGGAKLVDVAIVYHAATDTATLLVKVALSEPKLS